MLPSFGRWKAKVAVVTGANSGIGAATAKKLAEAGVTVIGFDKNVDNIEETSKQLAESQHQLHAVKVDLTQEDEILQAVKSVTKNFGPLSILVNNAGLFLSSAILESDTENWKKILDVNLVALCILCREAVKIMTENNIDGHIVNICSIGGHKVIPEFGMYIPSKFAVRAVTETIRLELIAKKSSIKIGRISPGTTNTPLLKKAVEGKESLVSDFEHLTPENLADAILFVLSTPPHVQIEEMIVRPQGEPF